MTADIYSTKKRIDKCSNTNNKTGSVCSYFFFLHVFYMIVTIILCSAKSLEGKGVVGIIF